MASDDSMIEVLDADAFDVRFIKCPSLTLRTVNYVVDGFTVQDVKTVYITLERVDSWEESERDDNLSRNKITMSSTT